jgi:hypothetical protein
VVCRRGRRAAAAVLLRLALTDFGAGEGHDIGSALVGGMLELKGLVRQFSGKRFAPR